MRVMPIRRTVACAAGLVFALAVPAAFSAEVVTVKSPDQRVALSVAADQGLQFSLAFDGAPVFEPSPLGLIIDNKQIGSGELTLLEQTATSVRDTYRPVVGKTSEVADHYQSLTLSYQTSDNITINLDVRAYDNGVALRYHLPAQQALDTFTIQDELTRFHFADDYLCWGLNLGEFENSHEGEFDPIRASHIREHNLFDNPLVCKTGNQQQVFALAESNVRDYAGAWFTGRGDGGLGVSVKLTPRFDNRKDGLNPSAVHVSISDEGFTTPWRVVMLGDNPGDLTESSLIETLAEPTALTDTSWIKPGKVSWDWWNDNQVVLTETAQQAGLEPGMNTETYKAYIDFAATLGLEYILIDSGWHEGAAWTSSPGSDLLKPIAAMDMPAILDYAKQHNVEVWLWVQWQQLDWQMEQALSAFEQWGVRGIKVDFMNRNDQQMVDYYHKLLTMAGKYHIMVNMHGAYAPNGLVRTYPHYLTQEGVLGAEYNKWSRRITATHNVTLPFTRMILGPIDYTPGGFRHVSPEAFPDVRRNTLPYVKTTRGQALAMFVVYDSPLQMLADSPITYSKTDGVWSQPESEWQDGLAFIRDVPVSWDETRVLEGDIGEYIVTARRKGNDWYLGAMTNEQGRKLKLPLDFLEAGRYRASIWQDGKSIDSLKYSTATLGANDKLTLQLAPSGGVVVKLKVK